jgi:hypothetical protein
MVVVVVVVVVVVWKMKVFRWLLCIDVIEEDEAMLQVSG